jgi:hypothetical protein
MKKTSKEIQEIHQRALKAAEGFKRSEIEIISCLQEVDDSSTFLRLGYTSLYDYMINALGFSESSASNFITVSRKAKEIPLLQSAIQEGTLSVSKARKITPVLTLENQEEWIEKAKTLPQRQLEQEVAREIPREDVPERIKFVSESRMELRMGISKEIEEKLRHVQDLESQRTGHHVRIEETLATLLEVYLEVKDPVRRADRILKKESIKVSEHVARHAEKEKTKPAHLAPIPSAIKHRVTKRDRGRCTHVDLKGKRCGNRRWIEIHHIVPRSKGGTNSPENLRTLCHSHHKLEHEPLLHD